MCRDGSLIYLGVEIYDSDRVTFCKDIGSRPACLYRSRDGGYTWEKEATLPVPAWQNAKLHIDEPLVLCEARDGDIGYPCTVEMDDGSLFTVYYQRYADDAKTSMLYTRWRL